MHRCYHRLAHLSRHAASRSAPNAAGSSLSSWVCREMRTAFLRRLDNACDRYLSTSVLATLQSNVEPPAPEKQASTDPGDERESQQPFQSTLKFDKNDDVDTILNKVARLETISVVDAAKSIVIISSKTSDISPWLNDTRFQSLIKVLEGEYVLKIPISLMVACLKALEKHKDLGPSSFSYRNLLNCIMWRSRKASFANLLSLMGYASKRQKTEDQVRMFKEVVQAIERRWVEINDEPSVIGALHHTKHFSDEFLANVDDRIMEIAENLKPSEIVTILVKKAEMRQRTTPVLKKLAFFLRKEATELNAKEIASAMFAINQLSFKDKDLLEALSRNVSLDDIDNHSVVRSLLTSVGQLGFRDPALLDRISNWLAKHQDSATTKDLVSFLLTTAKVNYVPTNSEDLYKLICEITYEKLCSGMEQGSEAIWLDIVWSLSILGKQKKEQLESVLSFDFYNKLLYAQDNRNIGTTFKLINLNAVATFLTPDYEGPLIDVRDDPLLKGINLQPSLAKSELIELVVNSFVNLATSPSHAHLNVNTRMGFHVDVECIMDSQCKAIRMKPYGSAFDSNADGDKALPEGTHRLVVIVLSFQDCLLDGSLGGIQSLYERLLAQRRIKTVFVTYKDINAKQNMLTRTKILEEKVKNAIIGKK